MDADITLPGYPDSPVNMNAAGLLKDNPETRAWLETNAIPKCAEWREDNPDPESLNTPAPYCCSAYCVRCIGLRALDGQPALLPNGWLYGH